MGEKWGMYIPFSCTSFLKSRKLSKIVKYEVFDTSKGQSGSPIIQAFMILAVHTGGSEIEKKNWGTHITPAKLRWMADTLGSPWKIHKIANCGTGLL